MLVVQEVCLQFLQVCSKSDPLAMTLFRSSHLHVSAEQISSLMEALLAVTGQNKSTWYQRNCRVFVVSVPQKARAHHVCSQNRIVSRGPLFVPMFLDVSFVRFLLRFVVVSGAWPLLADQYGVLRKSKLLWLASTRLLRCISSPEECSVGAKKKAESSNSGKKQSAAMPWHAYLLKVPHTDLSVLETPSHAVPRVLDTIHSLRKKRWKVLWSEVPTGKCLRLFLKWRSLCENVVEFADESVAEFI